MSQSLAGCHVVITRPAGQGEALGRALAARGARVSVFPTVVIEPLTPAMGAGDHAADWAVFVSPNAVCHGIAWLPAETRRLAAVGPGTAAALTAAGHRIAAAPSAGGGAEALLGEPAFRPCPGERVLVFRGEGGRTRLQEALRARGVEVVEVPVYRRGLPRGVTAPDWQDGEQAFTIVTSVTGLDNLLRLAGEGACPQLLASWPVAVSERVACAARDAGLPEPVRAEGAGDAAIVAAVVRAATGSKE